MHSNVSAIFVIGGAVLKDRWAQAKWPGFDFIIFDCDSTLSTIEGIDELARSKGKFAEVKRMTDAAMDGEVHLQSIYDRRLELLSPTRAEIRELEHRYRDTLTPDAAAVVHALAWLGKELFIISGGLLPAVRPFGEWLGIPRANIRAVDVVFNRLTGEWWDYQQDQWGPRPDEAYLDAEETPLVESQGKADVARQLLAGRDGRSMLIGDGMSDIAAKPAVDVVVGFGGVVTRAQVARHADIFITTPSLAPVLPLALGAHQRSRLEHSPYRELFERGLALIEAGGAVFNS